MEKVVQREYVVKRRLPFKKVILILCSILLIVLIITSSISIYILQKTLPTTKGEVVVSGISEPVSIFRDQAGVPHIEAGNVRDLYFTQGYITAQDRLFQMDLSRRLASGRLSEVVGEATVDNDKFFRTLGLRRAAEASWDGYSDQAKRVLKYYAEGVNTYIKEAKRKNTLPVEFLLMNYEPELWTPVDSLTIAKYMAFDLGGHWEGQAFRQYLLQKFPEEKALELFPSYPEDGSTIISAAKNNPLHFKKSFANAVVPNTFNGSNNWVVSGQKTESGLPLLANDPHLGLGTPSIWYETHLKSNNLNVSGVIFAGIPGVIVGHNENIAWGVTNVGPDVQDLYIEKRHPEDPTLFQYMGEWKEAEIIEETIQIKGANPVEHTVMITRHGPIISEFAHDDNPDTALALKWTALQPSTELEAVLLMNSAKDWDEFKEALTYFHTPAQNFVFASKDGKIAYRANGLIPIRKKGDSMLPVPGWTDEYEWEGFIPWDELPTIEDPDRGFIATANNKIVGEEYPYHITHTWAQPYRHERIVDVLSGLGQFTVEDMKQLQFDQYNLQAVEMIPILLPRLSQSSLSEVEKEAYNMLVQWNYNDDKNLGAPLLFHFWMNEISHTLFDEQIDKEMMDLFDGRAQVVDELIRNANIGEDGIWISEAGGLSNVASQAFKRTVDKITELQGDDSDEWKWGDYHTLSFEHPLGSIKPLNLLFNSDPVPLGGSRVTVMAAGWNWGSGNVNHGAAWRTVVDLSDISHTFNVVSPGQSGHVLSDWYDDQINEWTTGRYHITSIVKDDYRKGDKLRLLPEK
ncbi:penicillin acylase family protein [Pseudalkalibacillus decolorationis]|uniref:penicillin acylase family protein n=1 Tax=Pseudalkalibacillus decolorationis TaxID=163879 RepID=UPI0021488950|nr:penicillin acylase family protein [Pseudalkalibacillus decolorationis]